MPGEVHLRHFLATEGILHSVAAMNGTGFTILTVMAMLGNIYGLVSRFLKLTDQKSAIDYSKKNFVHADLTHKEFSDLQAEKGESLLGFALGTLGGWGCGITIGAIVVWSQRLTICE